MLFAELHGKLDPNAPDLERREDVLTSTTFGTLIVAKLTLTLTKTTLEMTRTMRRTLPGKNT